MEVIYVTFFILILTKHNLHAATHLILVTTLGKIYLHFTDKETERQRGRVTFPQQKTGRVRIQS